MANFQTQLKRLRNMNHFSQEEMAKKVLHCTRYKIADLERGKTGPTIDDINLLCDYFNVSADYLLGRSAAHTNDITVEAICDDLGLSDDALFSIMYYTQKKQNGSITGYLADHHDTGGPSFALTIDEWNDTTIKEITTSEMLDLILTEPLFYGLVKSLCAARENIVQAATNIENMEKYTEYEYQLFQCHRIVQKIREKLFSKIERKWDIMIREQPAKMEEAQQYGECD